MFVSLKEFIDYEKDEFFFKVFGKSNDLFDFLNELPLKIKKFLESAIRENNCSINENSFIEDNVFVGNGSVIEPYVYIKGPTIIGDNVIIRKGAYLRGNVFISNNCIIGNAVEIKESVVLKETRIPHLSYVGNSIIGSQVLLGAGFKTSNEKLFNGSINLYYGTNGDKIKTNLIKFGCIIGDRSNIGCNVVILPGATIGRDVVVYPNISVRGHVPDNTIIKLEQKVLYRKKNLW